MGSTILPKDLTAWEFTKTGGRRRTRETKLEVLTWKARKMGNPLRLLLVEDSDDDALLLKRELQRGGYDLALDQIHTPEQMSAALERQDYDLVISDHTLPGFDAFAAIELLQQKRPDIPLIIVSGTIGEEKAVAAIKAGATDYVSKDHLTELVPVIDRGMREAQNRAEQRRRQIENNSILERLQTLLDRAPIGCLLSDERFRVTYWNRAAEKIFGFDSAEVAGKNIFETIAPCGSKTTLEDLFRRLSQGDDTETDGVFNNLTKGGRTILCEWHNTPLRDAEGAFQGVVSMCQDITERRNMELQLRQAQKLESLGRLAGGIAHDFNNLLTVIQGYAAYSLESPNLSPELRQALDQIHRASERAAQRTGQLLAFSRRQMIELKVVDLKESVDNVAKMLCHILGEDIELEYKAGSSPGLVRADPGLIEQVFMNLAVNARDAMPKGGRLIIDLSVSRIARPFPITNPEARAGEFFCLSVTDTGCGISAENLPHIFEPFFTTKDVGKGTGLGLATAYGIVQQHQGWIEVSSNLGNGTTFRVFLPLSAEAVATAALNHTPAIRTGNETILVVEDEPSVQEMLSRLLRNYGYSVLAADSGVAALALWQEHRSRIDLLLTDLVMPGGMNGWELADRLKADEPALAVLYTSGHDPELSEKGCRVDLITKPYEPKRMAEIVRRCLDRRTPREDSGARSALEHQVEPKPA